MKEKEEFSITKNEITFADGDKYHLGDDVDFENKELTDDQVAMIVALIVRKIKEKEADA